jgi:putative transposon-encoded protein
MSQRKVTITCYDSIDRDVGNSGNSGRVYVPKSWIGKKVTVLLMEPIKEE